MKREKAVRDRPDLARQATTERVIRVTNLFVGKAPGGGKPAIRVEYEYTSGQALQECAARG